MPEGKDNKVKYGLKNVHYAIVTEGEDGTVSYGDFTPHRGAVNIVLNSSVTQEAIPADDDPMYAVAEENNGYEGNLEIQNLDDEFRVNVLGDTKDENGVIIENKDVVTKRIALAFEISGDSKKTRHLLYNCAVTKPNVESGTKGKGIDVKTDSLGIKAMPAHDTGNIKAKAKQGEAAYDGWFKKVYTGTLPEQAEE